MRVGGYVCMRLCVCVRVWGVEGVVLSIKPILVLISRGSAVFDVHSRATTHRARSMF